MENLLAARNSPAIDESLPLVTLNWGVDKEDDEDSYNVTAGINGVEVVCRVAPGSHVNLLRSDVWRRIARRGSGPAVLDNRRNKLRTVTDNYLYLQGRVTLRTVINGYYYDLEWVVVPGNEGCIKAALGRPLLEYAQFNFTEEGVEITPSVGEEAERRIENLMERPERQEAEGEVERPIENDESSESEVEEAEEVVRLRSPEMEEAARRVAQICPEFRGFAIRAFSLLRPIERQYELLDEYIGEPRHLVLRDRPDLIQMNDASNELRRRRGGPDLMQMNDASDELRRRR